jgi:hypothetical protein
MIRPSQLHLRIGRVVIEPDAGRLDAQALSLAIEQQVAAWWDGGLVAPARGPHAALADAVASTVGQRLADTPSVDAAATGDGHVGR